jgi:cellulose synthase/poly-beta-1,6-N-acetylglucosamine synthase-like glycosyltransferase
MLVVALDFTERDLVLAEGGEAAVRSVTHDLVDRFAAALPGSTSSGSDGPGYGTVVVPRVNGRTTERSLGRARAVVAAQSLTINGREVTVTPLVGYAVIQDGDTDLAVARARQGLAVARARLDLVPVAWSPELAAPTVDESDTPERSARPRLWWQIIATFLVALVPPYVGYEIAGSLGVARPVLAVAYIIVTLALLATALSIYAESLAALEPVRPPREPGSPAPTASAVIAAYLPNEQATIVETLRAFLDHDYAPGLQVVLAYNTPTPLPVEAELASMSRAEPRLVVLNVAGSTSKAQNVNAALRVVTGDMVGIFDADHHPAGGSFHRAWRWLSNGYGVVQGHCVIRNGDRSWVSRTVAVEFESIYALSHPGRAQLHGFGIFGGSNGYWRADLLRAVRLRGTMLTEDIDSSLRVTLRGQRIASDPGLISRELAPTTLKVLTGQRLRWAQGWSQVSREYALSALRSPRLSVRQKLGALFLLSWRELYPWLSLQMLPILAYLAVHADVRPHHWLVPIFVLTTIVTFAAGPIQTALSYVVAAPEIRARRRWFAWYALINIVFYTEFKNTLARVAQFKQVLGETTWRVTVRDAGSSGEAVAEPVTTNRSTA